MRISFRDRPDVAFPAVEDFIRRINNIEPTGLSRRSPGRATGLRAG